MNSSTFDADPLRTHKKPIASRFFALALRSLLATSAVAASPSLAVAQSSPSSALVLDRARVIELARSRSPEAIVARARVDVVAAARAGTRAWSRDNPTVSVAAGPRLLNTGDWVADAIVAVSAPVDFSGVSGVRPRIVDAQVRIAELEAEVVALEAVAESLDLWIRCAAAHARAQLASEQRATLEQAVRFATARATHGIASGTELPLAELARAQWAALEAEQRSQATSLERALVARLGLAPTQRVSIEGALDRGSLPPLEALLARIEQHPSLAVADARATLASRELELVRRTAWQPLRVSLAGGRENELYGRVGIDLSLPLFQRNEGPASVAQAQRTFANTERRSAFATREIALRQAYARWTSLDAAGAAIDEATRHADTVATLSARAFELGERDATTTIFSLREANNARRARVDWLESKALARLVIDRAIGAF